MKLDKTTCGTYFLFVGGTMRLEKEASFLRGVTALVNGDRCTESLGPVFKAPSKVKNFYSCLNKIKKLKVVLSR